MIDIVGKKIWYFSFSAILIVLGLIAIFVWGLNFGIDFTGGSLTEAHLDEKVEKEKLENRIENSGLEVFSITPTQGNNYLVRTGQLNNTDRVRLTDTITQQFPNSKIISIETIGPTVGQELIQKSILALIVATIAIILYIAWAFRSVPSPASSWRFGATAIVALFHDVLIVIGSFAILGRFFAAPIDSLFITAVLTIIGFSVHDTIVVYDRIRENLSNKQGDSFANIVNHSLMQTLIRSVNTSFTVVLVLLPILLFGGVTLRWFTVALLIGVISGTYSSIFIASPLLAAWQDWSGRRTGLK